MGKDNSYEILEIRRMERWMRAKGLKREDEIGMLMMNLTKAMISNLDGYIISMFSLYFIQETPVSCLFHRLGGFDLEMIWVLQSQIINETISGQKSTFWKVPVYIVDRHDHSRLSSLFKLKAWLYTWYDMVVWFTLVGILYFQWFDASRHSQH